MGKPLSRFLSHRNFMLHQIGQGIAISIAAQVLTTPLTLYYFHQFPGSFLLSNLVAVPLSSIILGGELLLCLLANLPYAGSWIGWMVEQLIKIMNSYVQGVEAIPGLLWKDLYWSFQETILLFLLSLFLLHWLQNCSAKARQFSLLIGALLLLLQATEQTNRQKQNRLVIYNNRSQTVMELMNSSSSTILVDTGIKTDSNLEKFILGPSHHFFRIKNSQAAKLPISFQYRGWRVVRPDKNYEATNQPADLLLITRSAPFNPGDWAKGDTIKLAVIDATCGWRTEERWRSILDSMKVPVHAVKWQGAFVHSFQ
jgi:competence protein ComEC